MRLYTFTNMYISPIQKGIQTAHVVSEIMSTSTDDDTALNDFAHEWAINHKTIIVLNGGFSDMLRELIVTLESDQNPYPWSYFVESEEALDGALTAVGVILPEKIYNCQFVGEGDLVDHSLTPWEISFATELTKYKLA